MVRYCSECGNPLEEGAVFCGNCGAKIESEPTLVKEEKTESNTSQKAAEFKEDIGKQAEEFTKVAKETGEKAISAAKGFASDMQKKGASSAEKRIAEAKKKSASIEKPADSQEIWSELKNNTKRNHYYTEEVLEMTEDEYMQLLADKIDENKVPAKIKKQTVWWDRRASEVNRYFVEPITDFNNPFSCLLSFRKIGKFTFVERTTFITPPNLPKVPGNKLPVKPGDTQGMTWGFILLFVGVFFLTTDFFRLMGIMCLIIGLVLLVLGYTKLSEIKRINEYNKQIDEEIRAWNAAWNKWETDYLVYAYQENIVGELSRIFDTVYDCINQVSEEHIKGTTLAKESETLNLNDMETLMEKRKKGYQ